MNPADTMPFSKLMGVIVTEAVPQRVVGELTVRPELCTAGAILHGGAIMAFADALGAIGAFMNLPEGATGTTTIESKTNFLGAARQGETVTTGTTTIESKTNFLGAARQGETVTAEATPIQIGKRLSVWQTRVSRPDGKAVALVTQTQLVL